MDEVQCTLLPIPVMIQATATWGKDNDDTNGYSQFDVYIHRMNRL